MTDVVKTKTFKNGGSIAVRIPAGWITEGDVLLSRDVRTGRILISQASGFDPNGFFDYVQARGFVFDAALLELGQRSDENRTNLLEEQN